MYYHCRPLKYVDYGKVYPPPVDTLDFMLPAYKWLGNYCKYSPQIWLSRSHLSITGFKSTSILKKRGHVIQKRSEVKKNQDKVMFGFDVIKGFPVSYSHWEFLLMFLMDSSQSLQEINKCLARDLNEIARDCQGDNSLVDKEVIDWVNCSGNLDTYLNNCVFQEVDQVVVPSLNLKSAKQVICSDERQKRTLRKMGFIEDRIQIKNFKRMPW